MTEEKEIREMEKYDPTKRKIHNTGMDDTQKEKKKRIGEEKYCKRRGGEKERREELKGD